MPKQKVISEKVEGRAESRSPFSLHTSHFNRLTLFLGIALVISTLATFWPVRQCDFINYDDPDYVYDNARIQKGLTKENVAWAFTAKEASNWHPMTWLSHMVDVQMHGLKPGGHHFTSLLLHTVNVVLLFLLLNRMTGAAWRSAIVAGFFALHPLRVESVAWISERKDVLSGFFFFLTLLAYVRYVQERAGGKVGKRESGIRARTFYISALVLFALGLMSKPMLVTMPAILLLLDYWPLRRVTGDKWRVTGSFASLLLEKIPFIALSLISSALTMQAQKAGGSVKTLEEFPLMLRIDNALVACVQYLRKMFWPNDLAIFYPHPKSFATWQVLAAVALLAVLTFFAIRFAQRKSFFAVGWFWFLIMLVPVIGLVQVGIQSIADRYTYLPMIGIYIAIVWVVAELCGRWQKVVPIVGAGSVVALLACGFATRQQVGYWRNNETLYHHALAVTKDNYVATENLGIALGRLNRLEESEKYLRIARDGHPEYAEAHHNLGNALHRLGREDEAIACYKEALRLKPDYDESLNNWGFICAKQGRFDEALKLYAEAERLTPNDPIVHYNMATTLVELNRVAEGVRKYQRALELDPAMPQAHFQLGAIYAASGKRAEAIVHFSEALRLKPNYAEAQQQLNLLQ